MYRDLAGLVGFHAVLAPASRQLRRKYIGDILKRDLAVRASPRPNDMKRALTVGYGIEIESVGLLFLRWKLVD